jgi:hypothetical protein
MANRIDTKFRVWASMLFSEIFLSERVAPPGSQSFALQNVVSVAGL